VFQTRFHLATDPPEDASGRERRRFARVALDAEVQVQVVDTESLFTSRIRDLSENGVFILSRSTRPIGTGIKIDIQVQDGGLQVKARGIIVHEVRPEHATAERPAGVGVMFTEVEGTTLEHLKELMTHGVPLD
jgi:Tfp pilus assembly protein PilZ